MCYGFPTPSFAHSTTKHLKNINCFFFKVKIGVNIVVYLKRVCY